MGYVAVLGTYLSVLGLSHLVDVPPGGLVLAVAVASMLSRRPRPQGAEQTNPHGFPWGFACSAAGWWAVALAAVAASQAGRLLIDHPDLGGAVLVLALSLPVAARGFGPRAAELGVLVSLPFLTLLVTPALPGSGTASPGWAALIAVIALAWVAAVPVKGVSVSSQGVRSNRHASYRMALQLAVALGAAFAVGRWTAPEHWSWTVLTAYVVQTGTRGRGDVLYRGALRLAGAAVGTAAATVLVGALAPGSAAAVVAILAVLGLASVLRERSYASWAAGMTAALALFYGYLGQTDIGLLADRLDQIALGAALSVAAAWFVAPIRTHDVLRRRFADALEAYTEQLQGHDAPVPLQQLRQQRPALHARRRLRLGAAAADAVDGPLAAAPLQPASPEDRRALLADVVLVRRRIGRRTTDELSEVSPLSPGAPPSYHRLRTALASVSAAVT